jgi:two-component system sensor histidine kinase BaeS
LAKGDLSHRVEVDQRDEFDELAEAFNQLAGELQVQEQQRIEALQQVGLTLNHELNNAMSVIEMQLQLVRRDTDGQDHIGPRLRQIQESLRRMAGVVDSLKHIQRIVLTDYREGMKMIDLEQSIRAAPFHGAAGSE